MRERRPEQTPVPLAALASHWQLALDAADRALVSSRESLPPSEVAPRRRELTGERQGIARLVASLARLTRVQPAPWVSPVPVSAALLGLPAGARACLFDLDGVLTDSADLHARAWARVFDELLLALGEKTGWHFIPFDRDADYHAYVEGRPRLEGIHAFLGSRGIRLPDGHADDPADAATAWGLARHKGETLALALRRRPVTPLPGAGRYLEAAGRAGLRRGVLSASASTLRMLELAGLAGLVDDRLDADVIAADSLRSRPAPDLPLAACRRLGVDPAETVMLTGTPAGVAAGLAGGLAVVGVDDADAELLRRLGARRVAPSLLALIDPRLLDGLERAGGGAASLRAA